MKIYRRVYCEGAYEGVYQLIKFDQEYRWCYVFETMNKRDSCFDYPRLNLKRDRNLSKTEVIYKLSLSLKFEEEDLLNS